MSAGLFLISVAILALEVLHMRILSVQMWYHHAYMILTMAMLGFSVAGTAATVWPELTRDEEGTGRVARRMTWCATLFGVFVVVAHIVVGAIADQGTTLLALVVLLVPYFFGGMVVVLALSSGGRIHVRYFVNLVGSALGAWLFIVAITPLGGERLLLLCAGLGPLAGIAFSISLARRGPLFAASVALGALTALFVFDPAFLQIRIGHEKRQHLKGEHIDQRWTPLTRLDLYRQKSEGQESIFIAQDGSAGTIMYSKENWQPRPLFDSHTVAYVPHLLRMQAGGKKPDVLVIGIGGGYDLSEAMHLGANSVLGIEINPEMVKVTGEDYAEFNGRIFEQPGISVRVGEGRSMLRRLDRKFDLILMAGVDTYTAGAAGAFVLSESYLYTTEALADFTDHLTDRGTMGILRFYDEPPRETLRILGMVMLELRRRGFEKPSLHVACMRHTWGAGTVLSLEPLTEQAIDFYAKADQMPGPDPKLGNARKEFGVLYLPGLEAEKNTPFTRIAQAIDSGKESEFYAAYHSEHGVDIRPVSDDSPFFFNFHHIADGAEIEDSEFAREMKVQFPVAPAILRRLLLQACLLVLALVITPLVVRRLGGLKTASAGRHLIFFFALGAGFMCLEISAVQRLILFLGHPTYALTVVLFSFLFFAGLGSLWSGRYLARPTHAIRGAVLTVCTGILVLAVLLGPITEACLHFSLSLRILVAIALLAPLNFVMGMPFPLGISRLKELEPDLVPWAIGANGGASVIGSVVAVIIAMETGFLMVSLIACVIYLAGMVAATTGGLGRPRSA